MNLSFLIIYFQMPHPITIRDWLKSNFEESFSNSQPWNLINYNLRPQNNMVWSFYSKVFTS